MPIDWANYEGDVQLYKHTSIALLSLNHDICTLKIHNKRKFQKIFKSLVHEIHRREARHNIYIRKSHKTLIQISFDVLLIDEIESEFQDILPLKYYLSMYKTDSYKNSYMLVISDGNKYIVLAPKIDEVL